MYRASRSEVAFRAISDQKPSYCGGVAHVCLGAKRWSSARAEPAGRKLQFGTSAGAAYGLH
eukprot:3618528-Lingulodinium_polyedra.AAC.1